MGQLRKHRALITEPLWNRSLNGKVVICFKSWGKYASVILFNRLTEGSEPGETLSFEFPWSQLASYLQRERQHQLAGGACGANRAVRRTRRSILPIAFLGNAEVIRITLGTLKSASRVRQNAFRRRGQSPL